MLKKLKRDSWTLGVLLGIGLPLAVYGLIRLIIIQWGTPVEGVEVLKPSTQKLLAIFSNLITFRYYMVNLKYDRTGRGILLVTFLMAGVFFYLYL